MLVKSSEALDWATLRRDDASARAEEARARPEERRAELMVQP
jgi:hypothetical protein